LAFDVESWLVKDAWLLNVDVDAWLAKVVACRLAMTLPTKSAKKVLNPKP